MKINGDASLHPSYGDSGKIDVNRRDALSGTDKSGNSINSTGAVAPQSSTGVLSAASVTMSSDIAEISARAEQQPNIRIDLVNELKAKIANGTYKPSPDLIASAMVNSAFDSINLDPR